jgi:pyrroline-5-carboxylate reductase
MTQTLSTIAVIGAGKLGTTLIRGLIDAGAARASDITVTAGHATRVDELAQGLGVHGAATNVEAVARSSMILLAVKPRQVEAVMKEIGPVLRVDQLLVSVAAAVSTAAIERHLSAPVPVVRAMPNTPAQIRLGMTALAPGTHAGPQHLDRARQVFNSVGRTVLVDEKHMDAVTALSASGPAYIYIIIESLAEAGVKVGLPRDIATQLAAQTVLGAGAMVLQTGEHPALLKDDVTTPAGCTIDGILELEEGGLRVTLIKAVVKATQRAAQLADA